MLLPRCSPIVNSCRALIFPWSAVSASAPPVRFVVFVTDARPAIDWRGRPIEFGGILPNTTNLTGGADAETADQGKIRARQEFTKGEHLGSNIDWENWIYYEVLRRDRKSVV